MAHQKADPLHVLKGVNLTKSFSNADDYVQSRTDVGEIKCQ